MHPGSRALRATRYGSARSGRGSLDGHPAHSRTRARPARDPAGDSGLPSPRLTGPRIKSNRKSKSGFASAFRLLLFASARRTRALCSSRGPHGLAAAAGDQARRVRARDRAHSAVAQDVQSAEPDRWRGPFGQDARKAQGAGACFFAYFLCTSKESRPLAEGEWKPLLLKPKQTKARTGFPPSRE